jgi:predicted Fe-Mo cluster-binding NifX family protein
MKIAFTTSGNSLNAPLDSRFGRAPKFLIYDLETRSIEVVGNNQNLSAAQGAGIQAAQTVARVGAEVVITGHCGPKAFRTLQAADIKVVTGAQGTVQSALEAFKTGTLAPATAPDVEGHWA